MKIAAKVTLLIVVLMGVFILGYELWGESLEQLLNQKECTTFFSRIRSYAWLIAIGLLVSDIVLPVPATGVMAALGSVYGVPAGTALSIIGSSVAGLVGYGLARIIGHKGVRYLASGEEIERFQGFFDRWGGYAVIISRVTPVLPEVVSVLSGLARMKFSIFFAALMLGTVPTCLVFCSMGYALSDKPFIGVAASIVLPLAAWPFFMKLITRTSSGQSKRNELPHEPSTS